MIIVTSERAKKGIITQGSGGGGERNDKRDETDIPISRSSLG